MKDFMFLSSLLRPWHYTLHHRVDHFQPRPLHHFHWIWGHWVDHHVLPLFLRRHWRTDRGQTQDEEVTFEPKRCSKDKFVNLDTSLWLVTKWNRHHTTQSFSAKRPNQCLVVINHPINRFRQLHAIAAWHKLEPVFKSLSSDQNLVPVAAGELFAQL